MKFQEKHGYNVYTAKINALDHGLPQSRERMIVVGIKATAVKHEFTWPEKVTPPPTLSSILDEWKPTDKAGRLPDNQRGKDRCKAAFQSAWNTAGIDPRRVPMCVDIDCSKKFQSYGVNMAKTLTKTRGAAGGPWVSTRGRRVTTTELMKLQGLCPQDIPYKELGLAVSKVGQMIGNAVAVHVMGRVLSEAMSAAGLTDGRTPFPI